MERKVNEYEILLSYLDKQEKPGYKPPRKNSSVNNAKSFEDISVKKTDTKKIIEECQDNFDTPQFSNDSLGFDVIKFENMMRARLIDDYKKMQSYERPYISVTELFYCIRKSYYSRLKYATDLKKQFNFAYLDLINRIGNTIHDYVQEIYNFTEVEKPIVSEKYKVKGRADAILDKFLYEFKTLDQKKFNGKYIKEHYFQAIIYAYILNSEYGYNIKTITLVYFFRNNISIRPYSIDLPTDDNVAISFLEQAIVLQNCISSKQVPDIINSTQEQCRWCPYISFCDKDPSKTQKSFGSKADDNFKDLPEIDIFKNEQKEAIFLL